MSKKHDRTPHEPGWGEVILGAALSVVLGAALGVVALVFRPVVVVKEEPKEPVAGTTYFIEGTRDLNKAKTAAAKRKAFAQGASGTFSVVEDEINVLAGPATPMGPPPAPKAGEKAKPVAPGAKPEAAAPEGLSSGTPNFRIRAGGMQIGFPVTLNTLGAELKVIVHTKGNFVKKGDVFVYEPETMYIGSCPVHRLPYGSAYVTKKFLAAQTIAEDIAATWPKLTAVAVEGSTLKLTLP
jgi:hypothetical protein